MTNLIAQIKPTAARHHDVEKEEQWTTADCLFYHGGYAGESSNGVSAGFEMMAEQARNIWIIFHYKDRLFHRPHDLVRGRWRTRVRLKVTISCDCYESITSDACSCDGLRLPIIHTFVTRL